MGKIFNAPAVQSGGVQTQRISGSDIGGSAGFKSAGAALEGVSDNMVAAQARIDNRTSTISRVRAQNEIAGTLDKVSKSFITSEDMADPKVAGKFSVEAKAAASKTLENFSGTSEHRAILTANLDTATSTAIRDFNSLHLSAAREQMNGFMQRDNALAAAAAIATGDVQTGFDAVLANVADKAGGVSPAEGRAGWDSGRADVVEGVFHSMIGAGNTAKAKEILSLEDISTYVDKTKLQTMRNKVIIAENAEKKGEEKAKNDIAYVAELLGKTPSQVTAGDLEHAKILNDPVLTIQEKLTQSQAAHFKATGKPMTDAMVAKQLGVFVAREDAEKPSFTNAGSRRITTQLAPKILDGEATEQDMTDFIGATTVLSQPYTYTDEDGLIKTVRPELTQATQDALAQMGVDYKGGALDAATPEIDPSKEAKAAGDAYTLPHEKTLMGLLGKGTGLMSAVRSGIAHIPGIGDVFPAEDVIAARTQLTMMSRELTDVLRLSNRGITEITELEKALTIKPDAFQTQSSAIGAIRGVYNNLDKRIRDTDRILRTEQLPKADRDQLRRFKFKAEVFMDNLGLPPIFKTFKKASEAGLPPGALYEIEGTGLYNAPSGGTE